MQIPDPKPSTLVKFHLIAMVFWVLMAIPTICWWNQSVLWVGIMSVYACAVGHFGAWDAARAEVSNSQ